MTLRGKNGRRTVKARVDDALRLFILEQPPIFMDAAAFAYQSIALADYGQTQEQQLATLEQLVLDSPYLLHTDRRPDNLDFRQDMRGWMAYHARATLDTQVTRSGKPT